jgi:hypothetical protein
MSFSPMLVVYIVLAWLAVRVVGWLANILAFTAMTKKTLQILCAAFVVLLPIWDMSPSPMYFQHLCEQEAGMKIPKTVELDQSYFRPDGKGVGDQASSMLLSLLA